jgi:hypothetical protein
MWISYLIRDEKLTPKEKHYVKERHLTTKKPTYKHSSYNTQTSEWAKYNWRSFRKRTGKQHT